MPEVGKLWQLLDDEHWRVAAALRLILLTGQRPGEVLRMRRDQLDGRVWHIPESVRGKSGEAQLVPLSPQALAVVEEIRPYSEAADKEGWLFPGNRVRRHLQISALDRLARRLSEQFTSPFRPHDLRRTAASHLGRLNVDWVVIQCVLGHKIRSVTRIYNLHEYLPQKQEALERWGREVEAVVRGQIGHGDSGV